MEIGVRVAYPERGEYDWYEALKPYRAVEVAFYDPAWFTSMDPELTVYWPWWTKGLNCPKVLSVHLPHVRITNYDLTWSVVMVGLFMAAGFNAKHLAIHPTNATLSTGLKSLERIHQDLMPEWQVGGVHLCWETFLSKRRFVNTIGSIAEAGLYACYDTSHMRRDTEGVLNDLETYKDTIKVVHLSNFDEHGQHLPLRQGTLDMRTILAYLGKNFGGPVILEYLREYHHLYLDDLRWAEKLTWEG